MLWKAWPLQQWSTSKMYDAMCYYLRTIGSRGTFVAIANARSNLWFSCCTHQGLSKKFGDKPKSVYIFLQTPHELNIRKSYFLDNSANKHSHLTNYVYIPMLSGSRSMIRLLLLWFESLFYHKYATFKNRLLLPRSVFF